MAKVWQTVLAICRSPDLVPKHFPEEGDGAVADFLFATGNHVVFAVDFDEGGPIPIGFQVLFAAPHGDNGVFGAVQEQDGAVVGRGGAVDVQLLGGEEVFAAELHGAKLRKYQAFSLL